MIVTCHGCGAENRVPPSRVHQVARCGKCKQAISPVTQPISVAMSASALERAFRL